MKFCAVPEVEMTLHAYISKMVSRMKNVIGMRKDPWPLNHKDVSHRFALDLKAKARARGLEVCQET